VSDNLRRLAVRVSDVALTAVDTLRAEGFAGAMTLGGGTIPPMHDKGTYAVSAMAERRKDASKPTDTFEHVIIVGAGLGGLRCVQQLRQVGYHGRISLVGAEMHLPYDRPPLSKQLLAGEWELDRVYLTDVEALTSLGVELYLGKRAVALRPGEVELADGTVLRGSAIVLATGVAARTLPGQPDHVFCVRNLDDSLRLRAALRDAESLLVVGAGFIGAEVASTALGRGLKVTMLEAQPVPLRRVLGERVGHMCARLIHQAGVDLRTGVSITRFVDAPDSRVAVELTDGSLVRADVAVVGVGGKLNLDWISGIGLDLSEGLLCDSGGRVIGLESVWALGDIASWRDETYGAHYRQEHWTAATEQAATVACSIVGAEHPPAAAPYVWSDQFGYKIQVLGRPDLADSLTALHGEGLLGGQIKSTIVGYFRAGELLGVVGFSAARLFNRYRPLVVKRACVDQVRQFAASAGDAGPDSVIYDV
jgi:NADPH-dependent 2,4-dienoyl-CoA reductase/sulfur reductase-like enzyme